MPDILSSPSHSHLLPSALSPGPYLALMPQFSLSRAVLATAAPPIPLAAGWAAAYNPATNANLRLINMSQGVPGSPPDPRFIENLQKVISDPASSKYGAILGEDALRKSMAEEYRDVYAKDVEDWGGQSGVGVQPKDIGITTVMTLCAAGDEVVLPTPWYFNHAMTLTALSIKPVPLPTDGSEGFRPSIERLRKIITSKTRAVCLVTPNNPTGTTLDDDLIQDFAAFCREQKIALIIDETYRDFLPPTADGQLRSRPHTLFSSPTWRDTVISLFSFSKSYAIPGHRLGVIVSGPEFSGPASTVLDCLQINAPRPPQIAIAPLLSTLRPGVLQTSLRFTSLLELFTDVISRCPGWEILSLGAFYACGKHPFPGVPATVVAQVLASKYGLVTLPGEFFLPAEEKDGCRWLRFAVANVGEDDVRGVEARLNALKEEDFEGLEQ